MNANLHYKKESQSQNTILDNEEPVRRTGPKKALPEAWKEARAEQHLKCRSWVERKEYNRHTF